MNLVRLTLVGFACFLSAQTAWAFTFLGPFKNWQTTDVGYQINGDIGGPMLPSEGYRWNVPTIYYAFDRSFVEYFGPKGMAAVDAAIKVLNDVPNYSTLSRELTEFPLNTRQVNYEAQALGLVDVKSTVLPVLLEEVGLANPERFVWTLRSREVDAVPTTNYVVIKLNYDPITLRPSSYVNGALYTFEIKEGTLNGTPVAVAAEIKIADLRTRGYSSVAGGTGPGADAVFSTEQDPLTGGLIRASGGVTAGDFFFGLTRDDVGGLRKLYSPNSIATEASQFNVVLGSGGGGGGPWTIPIGGTGGTNSIGTNATTTLRSGNDAVRFKRIDFDSLVGQAFTPFTVNYSESYITNSQVRTRGVQRFVTQPDIIFTARDLGTVLGGAYEVSRTATTGWANNSALNVHDSTFDDVFSQNEGVHGGPGVIQAGGTSITIALTDLYPVWESQDPFSTSEGSSFGPISWGSFDGSTNAPVLYPQFGGFTLDMLRSLASNSSGVSSPWDIPFISIGTNTTTAGVGSTTTP